MHASLAVIFRLQTWVCATALASAACASGLLGDDEKPDAAVSVDARPGMPDARPGMPDAATNRPDAAPGTPDAAPQLDAYVPPDAAPTPDGPCTMGWVQLLANRDFESGHSGWSEYPAGGVIASEGGGLPFDAQAGTWAAVVNAYAGPETLSQSLNFQSSATALQLRGWKCYVTTEPTGTAHDTFHIELRDGATTLETLESVDNLDVGTFCSWESFLIAADDSYASMTIQLVFYGEADGPNWTSYVIDTLGLEALACQ